MSEHLCNYRSPNGQRCAEPISAPGLCFWHDPDIDKCDLELSERLQDFVTQGGICQGLCLRKANLVGLNLVHSDQQKSYDLSGSDFYRANLQEAHLFNVKLHNGSLMKADLTGANLHWIRLHNTNLLGLNLDKTKIDNIDIGRQLLQERLAKKARQQKHWHDMHDNLQQAEEIYRTLRKNAEQQGLHGMAGVFNYQEILMRRFMMKPWSRSHIFSKTLDLLCGYGEKPQNTIIFSMLIVLSFTGFYFIFGVMLGQQKIQLDLQQSLLANLHHFSLTLYYSVVTFTTLGYGDITPIGITRLFSALEAFIGSFSIALFVVVFVRRMSR